MIANQLMLVGGFIFLITYLPSGLHASMPGYESFRKTVRVKGISAGRGLEVMESVAAGLDKKGYSVTRYPDQQVMPELDLTRMHVVAVSDPDLLVVVKVLNGWPHKSTSLGKRN